MRNSIGITVIETPIFIVFTTLSQVFHLVKHFHYQFVVFQIKEPNESIFLTVQTFFAHETLIHDMAEIQSKLNNDKDLSQSEINDDVPIYAPNI